MGKKREQAFSELHEAFGSFFGATARLRGRESHSKDGLSIAQYRIVGLLGKLGPQTGAQLCKLTGLSGASLSEMIDHLVEAGYVERTKSAEDKRAVVNQLSVTGQQCFDKKHKEMKAKWQSALKDMSDEEIDGAAQVLRRLTAVIESLYGSDGA